MTSLVTRKRSKWKSDTISRNDVEVHWDRYVDKLWKFCNTKGKHVTLVSYKTVQTFSVSTGYLTEYSGTSVEKRIRARQWNRCGIYSSWQKLNQMSGD